MKKIFGPLSLSLVAIAFVCCACLVVQAQNREKFIISAKAGGVNTVFGKVMVQHRGEAGWQSLSAKDDLNSGDVVRTGTDGRMEVLLNPGTYLRLPENSEFVMTDTSLDALSVRLVKGSAIVEAAGVEGGELLIRIDTPQTRVAIVRKGVYRINVMRGGQTEVVVRNGRALVGVEELKVKGGMKVRVGGGAPVEVAKYDKKDQDQFDLWSKERAGTLAQANHKLSERALNGFFSGYSASDWSRLAEPGRFGLWFFNVGLGCYTFLPFSYGWESPYGHSYITSIYSPWLYNYPYYNGNGQLQRTTPGPNPTGGGRAGGSGGPIRTTPSPTPSGGNPDRRPRQSRPLGADGPEDRDLGGRYGGNRPNVFEGDRRGAGMPERSIQTAPRSEPAPRPSSGGGRANEAQP